MTRRLVLVVSLVVALCATVVATATADVEAGVGLEIRLPLPALPLGPGPLYPLDAYGPRADDNAVLRWSEQTLASIRALKTGPTINARALAIVHTAMYDAWSAYDATAVPTRRPAGWARRPAAERTDAYKSQAISYAGYRALLNLFPARTSDFEGLMSASTSAVAVATMLPNKAATRLRTRMSRRVTALPPICVLPVNSAGP